MSAKILIVDDSIVAAQSLKNVIDGEEKYEAHVIHDGNHVAKMVDDLNIDVILLDGLMPELDGYDVLKMLKDSDDTKHVPVIMITGLSYATEIKKAINLGAMDCIRKTSEPIEIIAKVNTAITIKNQHDRLVESTTKDPMTKLYNKQFFNDTLDALLNDKAEYPKGISMLTIDTDSFKKINKTHGHIFGDEALTAIAKAIDSVIKNDKDFACRFGGVEFCAVFADKSPYQSFVAAERLRKAIEELEIKHEGKAVSLTVTIGIAHTDKSDKKTSIKLVNEAHEALSRAKSGGCNQTIYFGSKQAKK